VGATVINHVSISANDLDESTKFYEEVFGMERIPAPDFGPPVRWLEGRVARLYLGPADATASPGTGRRHRRLSETSP